MKLQLKKSTNDVWDTDYVWGYPFGIEKIDSRCYVTFREFGSRRCYLNNSQMFASKAQALAYLEPIIEKYNDSIVVAVTA